MKVTLEREPSRFEKIAIKAISLEIKKHSELRSLYEAINNTPFTEIIHGFTGEGGHIWISNLDGERLMMITRPLIKFYQHKNVKKSNYELFEFFNGYYGVCEKGTKGGRCILGGDSANIDDYNKVFFDKIWNDWNGQVNEDGRIEPIY